jgi:uncharacterized protein YycO
MKRSFLFLLLFIPLAFLCFNFSGTQFKKAKTDYSWLKEGDIVFQDTGGELGEAIKIATKSEYSHCGMIMKSGNAIQVFEAIGPVQYTSIDEWVSHGKNDAFKTFRLKDSKKVSTSLVLTWGKNASFYLGKAYDHVFEWSNEKIYCSELVWKMYKSVGIELSTTKQLKDFDLTNKLVKAQIQKRYGTKIPYSEKVVSPQDLVESSLLEEVKK